MKAKSLMLSMATGVLALAIAGAPAMAQTKPEAKPTPAASQPTKTEHTKKEVTKTEPKKDEAKSTDVTVGSVAPDFKLKDSAGKEHSLSELTKAGKVVVIEWFNPECPFVQKHYTGSTKTFNELDAKYKDKGVVLLAVNSTPAGKVGSGAERNNKAAKDWNIAYPILLDDNGAVGQKYGAKNTPAMFVIGKDGKIAYMGAIDDDSGADKPGKTNYVAKALDEVLANTSVTTPKTKPYGCHISYKAD